MSREVEVRVPDIGDFEAVDVVEILVSPGDRVALEDPLVSLESDKATMEVPSPVAGEVVSVKVALGDAVSEGSLLLVLRAQDEASPSARPGLPASPDASNSSTASPSAAAPSATGAPVPGSAAPTAVSSRGATGQGGVPPPSMRPFAGARGVDRAVRAHAGPLIRREARELGVDLAQVAGSGPAGRVLEADLKAHVRSVFARGGPAAPGAARTIQADIHALELWRRRIPTQPDARPPSLLAVVVKAAVAALRGFPDLSGGPGLPAHVAVVDGTSAAAGSGAEAGSAANVVLVPHAQSVGLRALAALLDGDGAQPGAVEPTLRLHHALGPGGRKPEPVRAERDLIAVSVGGLEVIPRWTGTPADALADAPGAHFEPRLFVSLAASLAPDLDPGLGPRFLDHWAEILASPARLLL